MKLSVISVEAQDALPHESGKQSKLWVDSLETVRRIRPDFIVLVCNWRMQLKGDASRIRIALAKLDPYSKKIILITQPPQLPVNASREAIRNGSRPPFFEDEAERAERLRANETVREMVGAKVSVIDGPFTESKELVGGFAILNANSKEEAIQIAKDFLSVVGEGECELRQLYEPGEEGPCVKIGEGEVALKA